MSQTKLLIVVPCYNEQEVLADTTRQLVDLLNRIQGMGLIVQGRILYVDDGSRDTTWSLIDAFAAQYPEVMGLKLAHNVGHQTALWAGLEWASRSAFDAAISIDADLQDDIESIVEMVQLFNAGKDIVYGVRQDRTTDTFFKKHTAQMFYKLMRSMGGDVVYNHADFRLMSRRTLQALVSYPERNLFLRGMVPMIGFPTASVYYDRKERMAGESKYPLSKMLNFALEGITSFSVKPIRLITGAGIAFIVISFFVIIYALVSYMRDQVIAGWTSLLISLWFIGGVILTSMGIIGEYIGKIYIEVKQRPRYFVEAMAGEYQSCGQPRAYHLDDAESDETKVH